MNELTKSDLGVIYKSLEYTKLEFQKYDRYPSEEFRQERIKEITDIMAKIKNLIKS